FLIFIILVQGGKGEGLSEMFGGGSGQSTIFGTRTSTFLTKATTTSAIVFMFTSLALALVSHKRAGSVVQRELLKGEVTEQMQKVFKKEAKDKETVSQDAEKQAVENNQQKAIADKEPAGADK
ncbi:MAG: preprotein translocase subunit SecG, partial [Candidatus Omnitrophica bacterium]|nr:preprotein translocase subunit SecG [Candidatus Omnitrophota bacterium]